MRERGFIFDREGRKRLESGERGIADHIGREWGLSCVVQREFQVLGDEQGGSLINLLRLATG